MKLLTIFVIKVIDRKSTRLNSSHANISYAVFCLKKKKKTSYIVSYTELRCSFFFFNDTATTEIYTLSLHDALPIYISIAQDITSVTFIKALQHIQNYTIRDIPFSAWLYRIATHEIVNYFRDKSNRSEEHTSELQSRQYLVCRLLLEKKKKNIIYCILY